MRMKILHVIDSGGVYGAEVMLLNLVAEQKKLGLLPTIASIGEQKINEKPIETAAISQDVAIKKFRMKPGPNYIGALKILNFARKNRFSLMHSHGYKGNILLGPLPRLIRGMPIIGTIHGYTSTTSWSKMRLYELLDSWCIKRLDAIVLVNKGMFNHINLQKLPKTKVHVIDNGIPIAPITEISSPQYTPLADEDQKILDFCHSGYILGTIGRYSSEKGYTHLVKATARLIKQGINAKLVIIGEGYERHKLEELAIHLNIAGKVYLTGYRNNASRFMKLFNVYVISSLTEGLPITLLEAMRSKIPVVATAVGGIPDVLPNKEAGSLIPPASSVDLADAVSKLFKSPRLVQQHITIAYNRFVKHYSSSIMAKKYNDLYKRLLKQ